MQNTPSLYTLVLLFIIGGIARCLAVKQIIVMEGETLTLTCPMNNTKGDSVEWRNPGGYIMLFNRLKGITDKRLAVLSFTESEYSMTLSNSTFMDGGVYKCIHYGSRVSTKRYKVIVLSAPVLEKEEHEDYIDVKCTASANLHAPRLSWLVKNGLEVETIHSYNVVKDVNKTHTAISHIRLKIHRRKVTVKCLVKHSTLNGATLMGFIHLQNNSVVNSPRHQTSEHSSTTPASTKTTIISTLAPQFSSTSELELSTFSTTDGSTQTLNIPSTIPQSSSTKKEVSTTEEYSSATVVPTEIPVASTLTPRFNITTHTSGYSESNTTDSGIEINSTLYSNTKANETTESIIETTEDTPSNVSINSSSSTNGVGDGKQNIDKRSSGKENSVLLVLLVTCLIICLIIVLAFFLLRLRRAHIAWKKENEEFDQSVESSRSKSSNDDKQKQTQEQRGRGFWNTSFTKYKVEETPEKDSRAASSSIEVIHEYPDHLNHTLSKPGIKETEL